jgi:hypothetical protein
MFEKDYDIYLKFWRQFGRVLKEGVSSDYDNKDKIVSLLLFQSSADPEELMTLKGYNAPNCCLVTLYWPKARKFRSRRSSTGWCRVDAQDTVTHRLKDEAT